MKIFLSYVAEDERHPKALETHLAPLVKQRVIEPWSARALAAGEHVSAAIEAHRGEASIVLVLASPDYLTHEGGEDGELAAVLRRRKAEGIRVIPVLVRHVGELPEAPSPTTRAPFRHGRTRSRP